MPTFYTPAASGGWLALVRGPRVLAVSGEPDAATVSELWDAVAASGFQAALDVLARGGLATMPAFALVDQGEHQIRAFVRGGVTVEVDGRALAGAGVSTWSEQLFAGGSRVSVRVTDAVGSPHAMLPLDAGAVVIASIELGAESSPAVAAGPVAEAVAPEPEPEPAPVPEQEPEPEQETEPMQEPDADADVTVAEIDRGATVAEIDPGATVSEAPTAREPEPAAVEAPSVEGYDYLFGETVFRDVADAAVHDEPEEEPAEGAPELEGDHDGQTVLTADIAKLRAGRARRGRDEQPPPPPAPKFALALANGTSEPLDGPVLVGRSPSVSQVSGGQMPRLLTIGTADQDISRTHARFALEGGTVVVTDLHSRNGTIVLLPGKEPQKLRAGEPTALLVGTVVDFGGGVTLTIGEA